MEKDLLGIYRELEEDHDNWQLWGVLADCYEDMNWEYAGEIRWLVDNNKRPYKGNNYDKETNFKTPWIWFERGVWKLKQLRSEWGKENDPESDIERETYKYIELEGWDKTENMKFSFSLQEAMEACVIAVKTTWKLIAVATVG